MTDDPRPVWRSSLDEETARWLASNRVTSIEHRWELTGAATTREWLVLVSDDRRGNVTRLEVPKDFFHIHRFVQFAPHHAGLVQIAHHSTVRTDIRAIDEWEERHARERAEYERLKAKFEGGAA